MTSPLNNLTDTWSNSGTVFYGLKYNITNTASAAGSKLFDFQVSAVSKFGADKDGIANIAGDGSTTGIKVTNNEIWGQSGNLYLGVNSTDYALIGTLEFRIGGIPLGLSSGPYSSSDVFLNRDGAGLLAQRNSTNAQTLRVYNTYTDASNYERGVFDWTTTSNVLTIGTQKLGTGSSRSLQFVYAGSNVADYGITVANQWSFNIGPNSSQWITIGSGNFQTRLNATGIQLAIEADHTGSNGPSTVLFGSGGFIGWYSGTTVYSGSLDLQLQRGAAGILQFASSGSFSADGTVATVLGSLGPTGANTTVQEWLTIKNASGTTRYIPCF